MLGTPILRARRLGIHTMAQQPHFSGMPRANWLSGPFSLIRPLPINPYGDDYALLFEPFASDRNAIGPRAAMALPNFEDSDWDSASQESDDVSKQHAHGRAQCATD